MSYRDDLEAALAHAEAAERDLADARREVKKDHARIQELERLLAEAKSRVEIHSPPKARPLAIAPKPSPSRWPAPAVLAITGLMGALIAGSVVWSRRNVRSTVDLSAVEPIAAAMARDTLPDAVLMSMKGDLVDARGVQDLATFGGRVEYEYLSPSRAAAPPPPSSQPLGAPRSSSKLPTCAVDIRYRPGGFATYTTEALGSSCGEALPGPPRCTVVAVWKEAIARGAPANALARVSLRMHSGKPRWSFTITDHDRGTTAFSMNLPDECPPR